MKSESSSFRDPDGFVFSKNGKIFRQINSSYFPDFDRLTSSGLYALLVKEDLLIPHKVISSSPKKIIISPQKIPRISYPYEWSFDMLKDAALLTIRIMNKSLDQGMILKDASAYNVQFIGTKPVFIDTLSFAAYSDGTTWQAYKQFCQHFLAPLVLMSRVDLRLNQLLKNHIDGIPIDLAAKLLPLSAKINPSLFTHLYLHGANQKRMADKKVEVTKYKMSKFQMTSLLDNLKNTIQSLTINKTETQWEKYYTFTNYTPSAIAHKHRLVDKYINLSKPQSILDLGGNNGEFSLKASSRGIYCIVSDSDPLAVNVCYHRQKNNPNMLPLVIDLTNPSPDIGWANSERSSFTDRFQSDLVMALALVHHLAISNNLPLAQIAKYLSTLGNHLIIEFIPKHDSKVQILLQNRSDIFPEYTQSHFEQAFKKFFHTLAVQKIKSSDRILYLMKRK